MNTRAFNLILATFVASAINEVSAARLRGFPQPGTLEAERRFDKVFPGLVPRLDEEVVTDPAFVRGQVDELTNQTVLDDEFDTLLDEAMDDAKAARDNEAAINIQKMARGRQVRSKLRNLKQRKTERENAALEAVFDAFVNDPVIDAEIRTLYREAMRDPAYDAIIREFADDLEVQAAYSAALVNDADVPRYTELQRKLKKKLAEFVQEKISEKLDFHTLLNEVRDDPEFITASNAAFGHDDELHALRNAELKPAFIQKALELVLKKISRKRDAVRSEAAPDAETDDSFSEPATDDEFYGDVAFNEAAAAA